MKRASYRFNNLLALVITALVVFAFLNVKSTLAEDPVGARIKLKQMGVEYSEQQFATSAGADDMTVVKLFLDAGMNVNAGGGAALGLAAGRGQIEMVKLLLSKGAKPTSNSLQFARTRGYKEIEKILIDAGAKE
jgi:hypothetical protein